MIKSWDKIRILASAVIAFSGLTPLGSAAKQVETRSLILDNGFRIVILENQRSSLVEASLFVSRGSFDDPQNKHGLAHLLEHILVGRRSRYLGKPVREKADEMGIPRASTDAFTYGTYVLYQNRTPAEIWKTQQAARLSLLRGIAGGAYISERDIELEKGPLISEMTRANYQDPKEEKLRRELASRIHPDDNCRRRFDPGPSTQYLPMVGKITAGDVKAAQKRWYIPQNMTLVVQGPIDAKEVEQVSVRLFSNLARARAEYAVTGRTSCKIKFPAGILLSQRGDGEPGIWMNFIRNSNRYDSLADYVRSAILENITNEIINSRLATMSERTSSNDVRVEVSPGYRNEGSEFQQSVSSIGFYTSDPESRIPLMCDVIEKIFDLEYHGLSDDELAKSTFDAAEKLILGGIDNNMAFSAAIMGFSENLGQWATLIKEISSSVKNRDISKYIRDNFNLESVNIIVRGSYLNDSALIEATKRCATDKRSLGLQQGNYDRAVTLSTASQSADRSVREPLAPIAPNYSEPNDGSSYRITIIIPAKLENGDMASYEAIAEIAKIRLYKLLRQQMGATYSVQVAMRTSPDANLEVEFEAPRVDLVEPMKLAATKELVRLLNTGPSRKEIQASEARSIEIFMINAIGSNQEINSTEIVKDTRESLRLNEKESPYENYHMKIKSAILSFSLSSLKSYVSMPENSAK